MDADVIVVGGGPRRPGGHRRAGRRRQEGAAGRPGARGRPGRPGLLVAGRADVRGQPRAAPHAHQGLLRAGAPGLDGHRGASTAPRTSGRAGGPRPTWASAPARSARGCTPRACAGSPTRAGPSAAATTPTGTATRCRASTSPGAPAPAWSSRSSAACARRWPGAWSSCASATASTSSWSTAARRPACGARSWSPTPIAAGPGEQPHRGGGLRARRRRPWCSPPAASAATTIWCARSGPSAWASHRRKMLSGVPAHVDGRMLEIAKSAGANEINPDRMWHYVEGIHNWDPIWPMHAIRIIPGPVGAVVRRHGQAAARPAVPRLRHARHAGPHPDHRPRLHVVRPDREDHREGVRPVGLRAEPGHHLQEHQGGAQGPAGQRPARARAGVQGPRRGLHRRAQPARPGAAA